MTIDYDVVIIGGSLAGYYAALAANQLRATVALVEPKVDYGFTHNYALSEIGKLTQKLNDASGFGIHARHTHTSEECHISMAWQEAMLYAQCVASNLKEQHSPAILAAQGVDVIIGSGQFQSSPQLAFAVNNRLLRARTYLLASGSRPEIPEIEGLQTTGYLNLSNIWQSLQGATLPKNWVIIGGIPQSIEIAQILARFGCNVTLVVKHPYILPHLDREIAILLQAQLEVEGVRVLTGKPVTQVKLIEDKKWIQAGDKAIETDEILVATGQQPNLESLNLARVGVKWHRRSLVVNNKLQTTNHRIYACGDVIGGYDFANIANYEVKIALNNALFFPRLQVNYRSIPWAIFSVPMLAQVGLTEADAKRQFGREKVLVLRQYFKTVAAAQLRDEITGMCKIIVLGNGEILGASILGAEAGELINLIALAMSQKVKVQDLANLSPVYLSFSEILEQTAREWSKQKLNSNIALQDLLEGFFHFRRNWNL
jgi:pyruvate/2-oxoglutarate dehydrogenase complex dihydrolipoamide dehydrogenase (E3) component